MIALDRMKQNHELQITIKQAKKKKKLKFFGIKFSKKKKGNAYMGLFCLRDLSESKESIDQRTH